MNIDDFVIEAENFFQAIFAEVEKLFGAGTPFSNALSGLASSLRADIEAVKVLVGDVEETLVATKHVWDQVIAFVTNVKNGIMAGPMADNWEVEALRVLNLGIPIALEVVKSEAWPLVQLSEGVAKKLLALM